MIWIGIRGWIDCIRRAPLALNHGPKRADRNGVENMSPPLDPLMSPSTPGEIEQVIIATRSLRTVQTICKAVRGLVTMRLVGKALSVDMGGTTSGLTEATKIDFATPLQGMDCRLTVGKTVRSPWMTVAVEEETREPPWPISWLRDRFQR